MKFATMRVGAALGSLLGLLSISASAAPFQVISTTETIENGLRRIQMVVQNGSDPLNRFMFHRVVKAGIPEHSLKGALILMPPLASGFNAYEFGDAAGGTDFKNSIAAHIAKKNIDVYGYSPRASLLAPNSCGAGGVSCPSAATWGFDAVLSDLEFIKNRVYMVHGSNKPAIGGLSLGAQATLAAINQNPTDFAGAVIWEGTLYLSDTALQAAYVPVCNGLRGAIASGAVLDDTVGALAKTLLQLATVDPNGASPIPIFPPGTTNRQALLLFFAAPSVGPPQSIFPPGFITTPADFATGTFLFNVETRLTTTVSNFHHYVSQATLRDIACGFSGERTYTNNLSAFSGPVLVIKAQYGFGDKLDATAALLTNADIDVISTSGYGHVTHHATAQHKDVLDKPFIKWLKKEVF